MRFLRVILVLSGTAIGFYAGGRLTQDAAGALLGAGFAFLLLIFLTRSGSRGKPPQPPAPVRAQEAPPAAGRKRLVTFGRVVWSIVAAIGVSGVIAILTYYEDQKDRERDRRQWAEQQYHAQDDLLRRQYSSAVSGRVFSRPTNTPVGNAAVGTMAAQGFVELGRTTPDGSFHIELPFLEADRFPMRLAVVAPGAGGRIHQTDVYLGYGEKKHNVNIFVLDPAYR